MPSLPTHKFFITISQSSKDDYQGTKDYLKFIRTHKTHLIIQESGKKGDHPHYHIYVILNDSKRADNYTREIYKQYYQHVKQGTAEWDHLLKVKAVTDLVKLIGWYFQKEESYKIVSSKNVDMTEYKRLWEAQKQPVKVKASYACNYVSLNDLPFYIIEHIEKNKIQMIEQSHIDLFKKSGKKSSTALDEIFTSFSVKFNLIWMSLFVKHKVPVHSYDRQQETIKKYIFEYFKNKI